MTPPVLVLSDRHAAAAAGHDLLDLLTAVAELGAVVLVREKDLDRDERAELATRLVRRCGGGRVVVASDPGVALDSGAHGVHLAAHDPPAPKGLDLRIGRSWHLGEPVPDDADHVTVSPVFLTSSKPGYGPPIGLGGLRRAVRQAGRPVIALGGIDAARARQCRAAGAAGTALMGSVMRATDPTSVVRQVLAAQPPLTTQPPPTTRPTSGEQS